MAYEKKKRSDKYEKKLKINATFDEAMRVLMGAGASSQNQNNMQQLGKVLKMIFPVNDNYKKQNEHERREYALQKHALKIPETPASKIIVEIEVLKSEEMLHVAVSALKLAAPTQPPQYHCITVPHTFKPAQTKNTFNFAGFSHDFKADTVIVECYPNVSQAELSITCYSL